VPYLRSYCEPLRMAWLLPLRLAWLGFTLPLA